MEEKDQRKSHAEFDNKKGWLKNESLSFNALTYTQTRAIPATGSNFRKRFCFKKFEYSTLCSHFKDVHSVSKICTSGKGAGKREFFFIFNYEESYWTLKSQL